jgi:phosphoglycerate kinase
MMIASLDDIDVRGRTVILRVDINSPLDPTTKRIIDDTRIDKSLATIRDLAEAGAKLVIIAHQGDTLDYNNLNSLREHAEVLTSKLNRHVGFIDDVAGPAARAAVKQLDNGDILLLDNLRYLTEEVSTFENEVKLTPSGMADTYLVRNLAPLADVYVNDAFAAGHRNSPSMVAFQELLPSVGGRLLIEETHALAGVGVDPSRPCIFLLGGLKISDAFSMMTNVLADGTADRILTSGITANVMLAASGVDLGAPSVSFLAERSLDAFIPQAAELLSTYGDRIEVPVDLAVDQSGTRSEIAVHELPVDHTIVDIGNHTVATYESYIAGAATLFVNGPAGIYESSIGEYGTRSLWNAVAASPATSVIGGGDTVASARRFIDLANISFISTGGGALIRYLSGQNLPLLDAMERAAARLENQ